MGDRAYDDIGDMGFPWRIPVGGAYTASIWIDGVEVSRLCINEVKLLLL